MVFLLAGEALCVSDISSQYFTYDLRNLNCVTCSVQILVCLLIVSRLSVSMTLTDFITEICVSRIPVVARSKAWVPGRSLAGIAGARYAGGHGCLSLVSGECCHVGVSAMRWFLVQNSPTECSVSECDREASNMRRHWPTRGCCTVEK
jgi:hypothetical protein